MQDTGIWDIKNKRWVRETQVRSTEILYKGRVFKSATEAAKALNLPKTKVESRAHRNKDGFAYLIDK